MFLSTIQGAGYYLPWDLKVLKDHSLPHEITHNLASQALLHAPLPTEKDRVFWWQLHSYRIPSPTSSCWSPLTLLAFERAVKTFCFVWLSDKYSPMHWFYFCSFIFAGFCLLCFMRLFDFDGYGILVGCLTIFIEKVSHLGDSLIEAEQQAACFCK